MNELSVVQSNEIPHTDFFGVGMIGGQKVSCAVLFPFSEKPLRLFVQREIVGLLTGNKKGGFDRYLKPKNLQPYVPVKFKDKSFADTTYKFRYGTSGNLAQGFEGSDLIDICKMYIRAAMDGKLLSSQKEIANKSEIIVFSFAKGGVSDWIDEVTGFDKIRSEFAVQLNINKYLAEELRPYAPEFPKDFYRLIYKLNKWQYNDKDTKRPPIVGKWTNQIIYSRFPKGVFGKIIELNARTLSGNLKNKQFQFLNKEEGKDALKLFLSNAIFLMEASANWRRFVNAFKKATKQPYQTDLFDPE